MPEILTVNAVPYRILRLLGKGKGGWSYLVAGNGAQCVLKQLHPEPCDGDPSATGWLPSGGIISG